MLANRLGLHSLYICLRKIPVCSVVMWVFFFLFVCFPVSVPTVLGKMLLALRNQNLTEKVVEQSLICLKEEWMK